MAEENPAAQQPETAAPAPKKASPWPALIAVLVLSPALSYATTQFLLIPKMKVALTEVATDGAAPAKKSGGHGSGGHGAGGHGSGEKGGEGGSEYAFEDIVVNVSGTKGTRYLKTSFSLVGSSPDLNGLITENKSELKNLALNILSSKTLVDLEAPGAKSAILTELQENFNRALKGTVVEKIYFSEFVIQ